MNYVTKVSHFLEKAAIPVFNLIITDYLGNKNDFTLYQKAGLFCGICIAEFSVYTLKSLIDYIGFISDDGMPFDLVVVQDQFVNNRLESPAS